MGNEEAKLLITCKLNEQLKRKFNGIWVSFVNMVIVSITLRLLHSYSHFTLKTFLAPCLCTFHIG